MMFISHYDKSFIACTNEQFDELLYDSLVLFKVYGKTISDYQLLTALFESDDIFSAAKYLFKSKKSDEELYPKYCNLAKLVYIFYFRDKIYYTELDSIVNQIAVNKISLEDVKEIL